MRIRVIDRHLAWQVILNSLLVLLVLTALASIITFVGELKSVGEGQYRLADAALYTLLYVPTQAYQMCVIAALIGTVLGLGELASQNELMVMRTSGVSVARLGVSALVGGVLLLVLCVALGEWLAPPAQRYADARRAELTGYNPNSTVGGIWARDGGVFLNIREMSGRNSAQGIFIYRVDDAHHLLAMSTATSAAFRNGSWILENVRSTELGAAGAVTVNAASREWHTFLSPGLLSLFTVDSGSLSARGLYQYIRYLRNNDINADRYVAAFWSRIAQPLSLLVMVVLALPFVFGPMRSATTGQRLVTGMLIGIGFFIFDSIFMQSGVVFGLNPILTAWLPTAVLAAISVIAVSRIR
ncbi:MAG: LPS export ABC transporter permease LptG [Gammaproteobacteria bacterium]